MSGGDARGSTSGGNARQPTSGGNARESTSGGDAGRGGPGADAGAAAPVTTAPTGIDAAPTPAPPLQAGVTPVIAPPSRAVIAPPSQATIAPVTARLDAAEGAEGAQPAAEQDGRIVALIVFLAGLGSLAGIAATLDALPTPVLVAATTVPTLCLAALFLCLRTDLRHLLARLDHRPGDAPVASPRSTQPRRRHLRLLEPLEHALDRFTRAHADRIEAERRRLLAEEAILDRLPDPLVTLDATGVVRRRNQAARRFFGPDLPAVLRHPALRAELDRVRAGGQPEEVELSLAVPVPRNVRATLIPLDPTLTPHERVALVLADHSRDKAVERIRADFVANVSHELRTPLTTLIGFTETLQGSAADDPEARERFLGIMADQGRRMSRLIDDLLSLSRIELVEHQPPVDPVNMAELVDHVLSFYAARRDRIRAAIEPGLSPVAGDADQLVQVLQNLLENALKYGRDDGTVHLSVGHPSQGAEFAAGGVLMAVRDEGPGIPAQHLPRLTERFYRVDRARSRSAGGTGLGLAIVKHIVNRHRGQLRIASTEGVGTTVSVWLPVAPAPPASAD